MSQDQQHETDASLSAARSALGGSGVPIGVGPSPRYELFHAANSICSQKVRCVLAQHGTAYLSHAMNLFAGQTYLPDYVRLRMRGCEQLGGPLAAHHSGSTSTAKGGCDGAVVPTFVDRTTGEVMVDSRLICLRLDERVREDLRLRPDGLAVHIDEQIAVVDDLPNYQMLMGRTPRDGEGEESSRDILAAFSRRKVAWCDRYLQELAGDDRLVRAYRAKRAKEASAADHLFSAEAMREAYDRAEAALHDLERLLGRSGTSWLFGERLTMADLFWGIELIRMEDVGVGALWEGGRLPRIGQFLAAVQILPAIRQSVLDWPGARF